MLRVCTRAHFTDSGKKRSTRRGLLVECLLRRGQAEGHRGQDVLQPAQHVAAGCHVALQSSVGYAQGGQVQCGSSTDLARMMEAAKPPAQTNAGTSRSSVK